MKEYDNMDTIVNLSVQELILRLKTKVDELETRVTSIEEALKNPFPRQRMKRNYQDYLKVNEIINRGHSINATAKQLNLPYTTVHFYAKASNEIVEKLKKKVPIDHPVSLQDNKSEVKS